MDLTQRVDVRLEEFGEQPEAPCSLRRPHQALLDGGSGVDVTAWPARPRPRLAGLARRPGHGCHPNVVSAQNVVPVPRAVQDSLTGPAVESEDNRCFALDHDVCPKIETVLLTDALEA
ncbi:hypothetical protein ABZ901_07690 [Actinacidiphila alni]|uniref:hypothetical protein n=1 Tax=Actinacidiphila alni TaxID=380248 RepID=UPI0034015AA9